MTINHTGNIYATGANAIAVFLQSQQADLTGKDITLTLYNDVVGGAYGGVGVVLSGGNNNTLTTYGSISALSEFAILTTDGNDTINNYGTVIGNVDLGEGTNRFNNFEGATFQTDENVLIGDGNDLYNAGDLYIGEFGEAITTTLGSNFIQTSTGNLFVDLSFDSGASDSDLLDVSEGSATVDGTITPNLLTLSSLDPVTVVQTASGVTDNGIDVTDTLVVDYGTIVSGTDLQVSINSVDFSTDGLNMNQSAMGDYFNKVLNSGDAGALGEALAALGNLSDLSSLKDYYDQLSPEAIVQQVKSAAIASMEMADEVLSCRNPTAQFSFVAESQCAWMKMNVRHLYVGQTADNFSQSESMTRISAGAQFALKGDWYMGGALGVELGQGYADAGQYATYKDERRALAALAVKYQPGHTLFAGSIAGGYGTESMDRSVDFLSTSYVASSDPEQIFITGQVRGAYDMPVGERYHIKPQIDFEMTHVNSLAFSESGAGSVSIDHDGGHNTLFSTAPMLEIAADFQFSETSFLRPYLGGGARVFANDEVGLEFSFDGSPASIGTFENRADIDQVLGLLTAGFEFLNGNTISARFEYSGEMSGRTQIHSGNVKVGVAF